MMKMPQYYRPRRVVRARLPRRVVAAGRMYAKKRRYLKRKTNPQPTFVETFHKRADDLLIQGGTGAGKVFKVKITDIPQVSQYANLYKQYRINWIKVQLIPTYNTDNADVNSANYNIANTVPEIGMCRIAYSIQDSPGVTTPATEQEVLEDNGAKVKTVKSMWHCSCKPVADITEQVAGGGVIPVKQKYRQWFNFDTATVANNPDHGSIVAYLTLPGSGAGYVNYNAYYKVNFSLRDPQ